MKRAFCETEEASAATAGAFASAFSSPLSAATVANVTSLKNVRVESERRENNFQKVFPFGTKKKK